MAKAEFKPFALILNTTESGTLLTEDEITEAAKGTWPATQFGVTLDSEGNSVRVDYGDASAVATVSGKIVNDHGMGSLNVTFAVDGPVTISVGQCTFSSNDIVVKNSDNETVVTKTPTAACWSRNHDNITELYYTGEATTLTVSGMAYCPYIAVATLDNPVTKYDISFALGSETAEGTLPATTTWTEGDSFATPMNFTLYKEGYTLTGWNDGTQTVGLGETYTPSADVTLTPVFTKNTKTLALRRSDTTIKWDFQRKNGAPTVGYQGNSTIWVAQANIDGTSIDVKMDVDATSGKFANGSWSDWAQLNGGTKFTIPSAQGAAISIESYNETENTLTFDGSNEYTSTNKVATYTVADERETSEIVIGAKGSYYRYVQIVLPALPPLAYNVTFAEAVEGYATFCPEVNVTIPEDVTAYTATVADGALQLSPITGVIAAGTGVILKGSAGATATFNETTDEATEVSANALQGTLTATEVATSSVYVLSTTADKGIGFYKYSGTTISANKAYYQPSAAESAPMMRFLFTDETGNVTGINQVATDVQSCNVIYDLMGRRVTASKLQGLYIVNGKKTLVR